MKGLLEIPITVTESSQIRNVIESKLKQVQVYNEAQKRLEELKRIKK